LFVTGDSMIHTYTRIILVFRALRQSRD
jgi:hypothetical protein